MKITTGGMVTPHVLHQKLLGVVPLIHRIYWHHPELNAESQALLQAYWIRNSRGMAQQFVLLTNPPDQFSCILDPHLHLRSWPTPSTCVTLRSSLCASIILFLKSVLHSCSLPRYPCLYSHVTSPTASYPPGPAQVSVEFHLSTFGRLRNLPNLGNPTLCQSTHLEGGLARHPPHDQ